MTSSDLNPLSKVKLRRFVKLQEKKYRDQDGLFLAEGLRTVRELCQNIPDESMLLALLLREGEIGLGGFPEIPEDKLYVMNSEQCSLLSSTAAPQGVIGVFRQQQVSRYPCGFKDEKKGRSLLIALDEVQDPGNVGTILRTAAWFGADALICSTGTADRYNAKVVRSSAGSLYALPHYTVERLDLALEELAASGYAIICSSLDGEDFRSFVSWPQKQVLVIGNEANGVSRVVQNLAERLVRIPHGGGKSRVESLNASVSAAILMERLVL
ncbi:TrmH family RNA methyltransferase [Chlorobium phaeobacteroides]|jgi:TrmH family RNA methyltransferase|uniref:tRNA/rRNA methyltransferase (SpoU) n=1 Tax=Chlorobium phaeobacteroides (strain DSM 266 / SMG 266 / 2430) TaxID=290317 RepID=A1BIE1_CHLPD|nr:RNA methyltransferase [Chlorobium phaeobacteroides]ABL66168.1 tRNA/rRNA methyltransferase (SpoU) [Chlorobium phaeobacteroides DSM 266]MBV5327285.1 RNA methyltransferase [Chlorobium sp.]